MPTSIDIHPLKVGFLLKRNFEEIAAFTTIQEVCEYLVKRFEQEPKPAPKKEITNPPASPEPETLEEVHQLLDKEPEPCAPTPPPEAKAQPETPKPAPSPHAKNGLTDNEELVMSHLRRCVEKQGGGEVMIAPGSLAARAGVAKGSMGYLLNKLEEKGQITVKRASGHDPVITLCDQDQAA